MLALVIILQHSMPNIKFLERNSAKITLTWKFHIYSLQ